MTHVVLNSGALFSSREKLWTALAAPLKTERNFPGVRRVELGADDRCGALTQEGE